MNLVAAATLALAGVAAAAPPASAPVLAPDHGLRRTLQDFLRQDANPPTRHLTPEERAQLRRQLIEYGRAQPRVPPNPEHR